MAYAPGDLYHDHLYFTRRAADRKLDTEFLVCRYAENAAAASLGLELEREDRVNLAQDLDELRARGDRERRSLGRLSGDAVNWPDRRPFRGCAAHVPNAPVRAPVTVASAVESLTKHFKS
jgi:hypothetical protein